MIYATKTCYRCQEHPASIALTQGASVIWLCGTCFVRYNKPSTAALYLRKTALWRT